MRLDEYAALDGLALGELVRRGEVTSAELTAAMTAAFSLCNPSINAIVELYEDAIDPAAPRFGSADGVFAGVPFLRKDLHDQAGRRTEFGSRLAKGRTASRSPLALERFERSGMHLVGRTAVPELGVSSTTESIAFGATRNPWNAKHTAGGSSGGAAAAVAAGIVPLADASDGGGSIRIPASCCGLVGLKPSRGRVSLAPARDEWGFRHRNQPGRQSDRPRYRCGPRCCRQACPRRPVHHPAPETLIPRLARSTPGHASHRVHELSMESDGLRGRRDTVGGHRNGSHSEIARACRNRDRSELSGRRSDRGDAHALQHSHCRDHRRSRCRAGPNPFPR